MDNPLKIRTLFTNISSKIIVLPDFQREFEWDFKQQKSLLASILVNLSIGALLMIKGKKEEFIAKKIGYSKNNEETGIPAEFYYLLDGQQRLTSIWSFFRDPYRKETEQLSNGKEAYKDWETVFDNIYNKLNARWFVSLKSKKDYSDTDVDIDTDVDTDVDIDIDEEQEETFDFFGYNNLSFEKREVVYKEPSQIIQNIIYKKIFKKNQKEWFHPAFFSNYKKNTASPSNKQKLKIFIEEAARRGWIPLYAIDNVMLIRVIIQHIANNRKNEIMEEIQTSINLDSKFNIQNFKERIKKLMDVDTSTDFDYDFNEDFISIEDIESWNSAEDINKDIPKISKTLEKRKERWSSQIEEYFTTDIYETKITHMTLEDNQLARAIAIFTAVNEGGQKLSAFDLVVAKAAKYYKQESLLQQIKKSIDTPIDITNSKLITSSLLSEYSEEDKKIVTNWTLKQMGGYKDKTINAIDDKFKMSFLNVLSAIVHSNFKNDKTSFAQKLDIEQLKNIKHLEMTPQQIAENFNLAMTALQRAHAFLQFRCGIISGTDLQYRMMLIPIAFCLLDDECWNNKECLDLLEAWYWSSIFSGYYRDEQNSKAILDTKYLFKMLVLDKNKTETESKAGFKNIPDRINSMFKESGYCDKTTLCLESNSAKIPTTIHNAILQYILSTEPYDFLPPKQFKKYRLRAWKIAYIKNIEDAEEKRYYLVKDENQNLIEDKNKFIPIKDKNDHHIYPISGTRKIWESTKELRKDKSNHLNSVINRTYISNAANSAISNMEPSKYFSEMGQEILKSHFADCYLNKKGSHKKISNVLSDRYDSITKHIDTEIKNLAGLR